jgi:hypothetical protein
VSEAETRNGETKATTKSSSGLKKKKKKEDVEEAEKETPLP